MPSLQKLAMSLNRVDFRLLRCVAQRRGAGASAFAPEQLSRGWLGCNLKNCARWRHTILRTIPDYLGLRGRAFPLKIRDVL
jgi:hypothetical protein